MFRGQSLIKGLEKNEHQSTAYVVKSSSVFGIALLPFLASPIAVLGLAHCRSWPRPLPFLASSIAVRGWRRSFLDLLPFVHDVGRSWLRPLPFVDCVAHVGLSYSHSELAPFPFLSDLCSIFGLSDKGR